MCMLLSLIILNASVYCSRYMQSGRGFWFRCFLASPCGPVRYHNLTCLKCKQALFCCTVHLLYTMNSDLFIFFMCALVCINVSVIWTPYIMWFFGVFRHPSVLFLEVHQNLSSKKLAENTVLHESPFNLLIYFAGYSK